MIGDCCGNCPESLNDEERQVAEDEGKIYVQEPIAFLSDDPGHQEIGSFYPLGPGDYTNMAYFGSSQVLCEVIVDGDVAAVRSWCEQSTCVISAAALGFETVQCLIDCGARLVWLACRAIGRRFISLLFAGELTSSLPY